MSPLIVVLGCIVTCFSATVVTAAHLFFEARRRVVAVAWASGSAALLAADIAAASLVDPDWLAAGLVVTFTSFLVVACVRSACRQNLERASHAITGQSGRMVALRSFQITASADICVVIAAWLSQARADRAARASAALTLTGFVTVFIAVGPIRSFVNEIATIELAQMPVPEKEPGTQSPNGEHDRLRHRSMIGFASAIVATGAAFLANLLEAGSRLHIERYTAGAPRHLALVFTIAILSLTATVLLVRDGERQPAPPQSCPLPKRGSGKIRTYVGVVFAMSAVAGVVLSMVASRQHSLGLAIGYGVLSALLAEESFSWQTTLSLGFPPRGVTALLPWLAGAATGVWVFWLLSVGLWSAHAPAHVAPSILAAACALLPTAVVRWGSIRAIRWSSLPECRRVHDEWQHAAQDPLIFFLLIATAAVIPVALLGRLDAAGVPGRGLTGVVPILGIAALVGLCWFLMLTNLRFAAQQRNAYRRGAHLPALTQDHPFLEGHLYYNRRSFTDLLASVVEHRVRCRQLYSSLARADLWRVSLLTVKVWRQSLLSGLIFLLGFILVVWRLSHGPL